MDQDDSKSPLSRLWPPTIFVFKTMGKLYLSRIKQNIATQKSQIGDTSNIANGSLVSGNV